MWEKLSADGGIHDENNVYAWENARFIKVAALNGGGGFASHTDWRLPNVNELQSLVSYGAANRRSTRRSTRAVQRRVRC